MLRDTDKHLMQAATLTTKPWLASPHGAATAGEPNQCPSLSAGLLHPKGQEQERWKPQTNCSQVARTGTRQKAAQQ